MFQPTMPLTLLRMLFASVILLPTFLFSANQGSGKLSVQGRIIATACAIDTESSDQTINIGVMPIGRVIRDGQGETHSFSIKLINCTLENPIHPQKEWHHFEITFDGKNDHGHFGLTGKVEGIALQISDAQGQVAMPGVPLPKNKIEPGTMTLNYTIRFVGNNQIVEAGEYYSIVRYKMDYY